VKEWLVYRIGKKENADLHASATFNFQNNFSQIVDSMQKSYREANVNYHKTFLTNLLEKARIHFSLEYNNSIFDKILNNYLKK